MYRSVVDYTFKNVFLTFYILQAGPPNVINKLTELYSVQKL